MKRSEKAIQNDTLLAITAEPDVMFWREQSAQAWVGRVVDRKGGRVTLEAAMPIVAGVPGIGDVMGVQKRTCRCGEVFGQSIAFEIKTPEGSQEMSQKNFQRVFEARGGAYQIVRDPQEAVDFLRASVRK